MTTIQIKLEDAYVEHLLAIISDHKEIRIDDIAIEGASKNDFTQKHKKKQKLMRIASECASLPTLNHQSPDQLIGYEQSEMGLWGND